MNAYTLFIPYQVHNSSQNKMKLYDNFYYMMNLFRV